MIAEKLNELYERQAEVKQALSHVPWFPRASGCGGCLREMAHLAAGYRRRAETGDSLRTFELGHQRGEALERLAKEIWPDAETQIEVRIPLPGCKQYMLGHLDLWIPSLRTIVDFKTTGSFKAGLLVGGKEGAGEEYEMQLQAYRHGILLSRFQHCPNEAIRCVLVFEAKDTDARKGVKAGQLIEVEVPHTDELEQRFQARLQELGSMMAAREYGELDPTTYEGKPKDHWKCRVDEKTGRPLYCGIGPIIGRCHEGR